ncbi:c-type cytochrome [Vibrio mexicanus]|uniref:c-type cytochrome n=1 Tax=Vibrio mexicanus TaxID=1004326 RepID=UPI00063C1FA4|nr:cytochrome c [Vibrio mexicanus]
MNILSTSQITSALCLVSALSFQATASTGDPIAGKMKSPSCVFCHSVSGPESNPAYPNLKSQNELYLFNSMKDYQNGLRGGAMADMMKAQLQHLNDQDLRDVAAYYSGLND